MTQSTIPSVERSEVARAVYDKIVDHLTREHESLERAVKSYSTGTDGASDFAFAHAYQYAADVIYNDILPVFGLRAEATGYKLRQIVNALIAVRDSLGKSPIVNGYGSTEETLKLNHTSLVAFSIRQAYEAFNITAAKLDEALCEVGY